jgi:hypothetical protein
VSYTHYKKEMAGGYGGAAGEAYGWKAVNLERVKQRGGCDEEKRVEHMGGRL